MQLQNIINMNYIFFLFIILITILVTIIMILFICNYAIGPIKNLIKENQIEYYNLKIKIERLEKQIENKKAKLQTLESLLNERLIIKSKIELD